MRIAVAQFAVGTDVQSNLQTCLRMLDQAGQCQPDLIVLPEFCNHLSWYDDRAHCHAVSVELSGPFLQAIADRAQQLKAHVVINCTVRRTGASCSGSSLLFGPGGELLASSDKQVLIGHENDFLCKASQAGPVVETPLGRIGLYACMDGVISETPRALALRGAQLLCNSLNSFAADEGALHIPVRAAENKVFVAAANKVGPLIPEALLEPVSEQTGIPAKFLMGAGESQIVAPDGTVLARASTDREEVVYADIDIADAAAGLRPDGSHIFALRRPSLYRALGQDPARQKLHFIGAESVHAALIQLADTGVDAPAEVADNCAVAFAAGAQLIALPPLFFLPQQVPADSAVEQAREQSELMVEFLAALCGPGQYIASTLVLGQPARLCGVLVGAAGLVLEQGQLHRSERFAWSALADRLEVAEVEFGRLAVLTSDDACVPEIFRVAALAAVDTVVVPVQPQERWELALGLLERAAENRLNMLAVTQPGPLGSSFAAALTRDFTVMTPWRERAFDGLLSRPPVQLAGTDAGITHVEIHPRWAENKVVSRGTDLLADRPWQLIEAICAD